MKPRRPDRRARLWMRIIGASAPGAEREWITGDVEEEFSRQADAHGITAARRWLRGEAWRTVMDSGRLRRQMRTQPDTPRGDRLMQALLQDLQYAGRLLARAPGFTFVAVLTLALGIGANAAIFSVVHGVLLKPLPYPDPDRLVRVFDSNDEDPKFPMAPGNFKDYRDQVTAFEALAAYERADLQLGGDRPEQLRGMRVTSGFFTMLGAPPIMGRDFNREEEIALKPPTTLEGGGGDAVILSDTVWKRRFGSDPGVIGKPVLLSGRTFVVVGVLPPGFQHVGSAFRSYSHGETVDVWWIRKVPAVPQPFDRFQHYLNVVGRLRPGVTLDQAQGELTAAASRLAATYPANRLWSAKVTPLKDEIVGGNDATLLVLFGAVQLVLLLACANVAGLLVGRATARAREIGVRAALGATRPRLIRQLIVESFLLATLGGIAGIALAAGALRLLPQLAPADTPRLHAIALETTVLAYTIGATFVTALLFGLGPALQLAWTSVNDTLKHASRGAGGAPHQRLRRLLVAAEIALAFVLVVGSGLLLRSFVAMTRADPGFAASHVLTAGVTLPTARYGAPGATDAFYARLRERVGAIPGVRDVGFGSALPWTGYDENTGYSVVGRPFLPDQEPSARFHFATAGFFNALGQPLLAGREVGAGDIKDAPPVVVVNLSLAAQHWPGKEAAQSALGARLKLWGQERTIIGVVGDIKDTPWSTDAQPAIHFPAAQASFGQDMFLTVRADIAAESLTEPVARALREIDPALPLANVLPLDRIAGGAFATRRFLLVLVALFGATALLLAIVGVYGVMAQAVGLRAREFGLRQALGARPTDILRLVMGAAAAIGVAGVVIGCALALAATRLLTSVLYQVDPADPLTFAAVSGLLFAVALVASYVPARRATVVDPALVLKGE